MPGSKHVVVALERLRVRIDALAAGRSLCSLWATAMPLVPYLLSSRADTFQMSPANDAAKAS
jgi:hypothetical protein